MHRMYKCYENTTDSLVRPEAGGVRGKLTGAMMPQLTLRLAENGSIGQERLEGDLPAEEITEAMAQKQKT